MTKENPEKQETVEVTDTGQGKVTITVSEAEKQSRIAAANQGSVISPENDGIQSLPGAQSLTHNPNLAPVATPSTAAPGDIQEWGPYSDYQIVNTGFGEYGIEKGKILFFEKAQTFNAKAGALIWVNLPRYRREGQSQESAIAEFNEYQASRPVRG